MKKKNRTKKMSVKVVNPKNRVSVKTKTQVSVKVAPVVAFSVITTVALALSVAIFAVEIYKYAYAAVGCPGTSCITPHYDCQGTLGSDGWISGGCYSGILPVNRAGSCTQEKAAPTVNNSCFTSSCNVGSSCGGEPPDDGGKYCIKDLNTECVQTNYNSSYFTRGIAVGMLQGQTKIEGGQDHCTDDFTLEKNFCVPPNLDVPPYRAFYVHQTINQYWSEANGLMCADGVLSPCVRVDRDASGNGVLRALDSANQDAYHVIFVPSGFSPEQMPKFVDKVKYIVANSLLDTNTEIYNTPDINFYVVSPAGLSGNWGIAFKQLISPASQALRKLIPSLFCVYMTNRTDCEGKLPESQLLNLINLLSSFIDRNFCFSAPVPAPYNTSITSIPVCVADVALVTAIPYCQINTDTVPRDRIIPVVLRNSPDANIGLNLQATIVTDTNFALHADTPVNLNPDSDIVSEETKQTGRYVRNLLNNYVFKLGDIRWPQDDTGKIDFTSKDAAIQSIIKSDRDFWALPDFSLNNQLGFDLSINKMSSIFKIFLSCASILAKDCATDETCRDGLENKVKNKCGDDVFTKIEDKIEADINGCTADLNATCPGVTDASCLTGCEDQAEQSVSSFDSDKYLSCTSQDCGDIEASCDWADPASCLNACADKGNNCSDAFDPSPYLDNFKLCAAKCGPIENCLDNYKGCVTNVYNSNKDSVTDNDCLKGAMMDAALGYCAENLAPADGKACLQALYNNFLGWEASTTPDFEVFSGEEKKLKQLDYYLPKVKDVVNSCTLYSCSRWEQIEGKCVYNVGLGGITTAPENTGMMFDIAGSDILSPTNKALACCTYRAKFNYLPDFCSGSVNFATLCTQRSVQDIINYGEGWNAEVAEFLSSADTTKNFLIKTVNDIKLMNITFINTALQEELDKVIPMIDDGKATVIDAFGDPASNDPKKVQGLINQKVMDLATSTLKDYLIKNGPGCKGCYFETYGKLVEFIGIGAIPLFIDPYKPQFNKIDVKFR